MAIMTPQPFLRQKIVGEELRRLLHGPAKVVLLSGEWGVGKTYLVKEYFDKDHTAIYVSLYGASSIDDVRSRCIASWFSKATGRWRKEAGAGWGQLLKWIPGFGKRSDSLNNFAQIYGIPNVGQYPGIATLGFHALIDSSDVSLIIIDDIERRSKKELNFEELLGFADILREKHSIAVILVGNFDEVNDTTSDVKRNSRAEFGAERAIASEVVLNPTIEEICNISVSRSPNSEVYQSPLQGFCEAVGTVNLRLIGRSIEFSDHFISITEDLNLREHFDAMHILRLYLCLVFARWDKSFGLEWVDARSIANVGLLPEYLNEDSERAKRCLEYARSINMPDIAFPELIIEHVEWGVLDPKKVCDRINALAARDHEQRSVNDSQRWNDLWYLYYSTFDDNRTAIVEAISDFLENEANLLDMRSYSQLKNLADAVSCDVSEYEQEVKRKLILNSPAEQLPDLLKSFEGDDDIVIEIERRIARELKPRSLSDVASKAIHQRGWSDGDCLAISEKSEGEIIDWLKDSEEDKTEMVRQLLTMDKGDKINGCLKKLSKTSDLNRMRCELLYGIKDSDDQD